MLKLLKLAIRMLRLARRSRVRRVSVNTATSIAEACWQGLTRRLHPYVWTVLRQLLMFLVVVHLFGCLQYALSDASSLLPACAGDGRGGPMCWPYRATILQPAHLRNGSSDTLVLPGVDVSGGTLYLSAFFHAASQMCNGEFGLGGDPQFVHEYVLVMISTLVGIYFQARATPSYWHPSATLCRLPRSQSERRMASCLTRAPMADTWQALIIASLTAALDRAGQSTQAYRDRIDKLDQSASHTALPYACTPALGRTSASVAAHLPGLVPTPRARRTPHSHDVTCRPQVRAAEQAAA
jgi:hypothetical protein